MHHQTVQRCVERALAYGPTTALDDRPRPGKEPTITAEAKAWLVSLACRKAKELGYPRELWTTRLLARHAREHGPAEGHGYLAKLVQGTVCKILNEQEVKPHKVRYYLERLDPNSKPRWRRFCAFYRQVKIIKEIAAAAKRKPSDAVAIVSYDEKPGIQAIATTAPDLSPEPGPHATFVRDHEYKRNGTVSLLAGIDLLTGEVHALVRDRHRSREFIEFLKLLDAAYPTHTAIKLILDNHSAHISKETKARFADQRASRLEFTFTLKHGYRGRDGHCWPPPAQIRACPIQALGSYLECMTRNRLSLTASRMRPCACDTASRLCVRPVLCWSAFLSVPPLPSTDSATVRTALFAGLLGTTSGSDCSVPCIIGYGLRPSRCGPVVGATGW